MLSAQRKAVPVIGTLSSSAMTGCTGEDNIITVVTIVTVTVTAMFRGSGGGMGTALYYGLGLRHPIGTYYYLMSS